MAVRRGVQLLKICLVSFVVTVALATATLFATRFVGSRRNVGTAETTTDLRFASGFDAALTSDDQIRSFSDGLNLLESGEYGSAAKSFRELASQHEGNLERLRALPRDAQLHWRLASAADQAEAIFDQLAVADLKIAEACVAKDNAAISTARVEQDELIDKVFSYILLNGIFIKVLNNGGQLGVKDGKPNLRDPNLIFLRDFRLAMTQVDDNTQILVEQEHARLQQLKVAAAQKDELELAQKYEFESAELDRQTWNRLQVVEKPRSLPLFVAKISDRIVSLQAQFAEGRRRMALALYPKNANLYFVHESECQQLSTEISDEIQRLHFLELILSTGGSLSAR